MQVINNTNYIPYLIDNPWLTNNVYSSSFTNRNKRAPMSHRSADVFVIYETGDQKYVSYQREDESYVCLDRIF